MLLNNNIDILNIIIVYLRLAIMKKKGPTSTSKEKHERKQSILIPSRLANISHDDVDGFEEKEIAAEISVSPDGGWGWVVVVASFFNTFIVDGIYYTFGSLYPDMIEDLGVESTLVALMNSIAASFLFLLGPLASALINRFGFRFVTMTGSVVVTITFICTYCSSNYGAILIFYGFISGLGGCLISMSSVIIVGFYFDHLRLVAMSMAGAGSSIGIMVMSKINSILVNMYGWRITTLIHSSLISCIFFSSMTFRPLLSITVTQTTDEPTRTVTYLPSLSTAQIDRIQGTIPTIRSDIKAGVAERLFKAVSNYNFPTAATVVEEGITTQRTTSQAGPSGPNISRLTVIAHTPEGGISRRLLKDVETIKSRASMLARDENKEGIEITVQLEVPKQPSSKKRWWARLCHWEKHIPESRPMYRDDAFYAGRIENLPVYQKSVADVPQHVRSGLEYKLAVSRAVTTDDLEERRGVFTTAARRVLASMMDPNLLQRYSFLLICLNGFFLYLGTLIPYVFLADRNMSEGMDPYHCSLFVSVIGFANLIGRTLACLLALKFDVVKLYQASCALAGVGTIGYNISFNLYHQYACCIFFGIFVASGSCLRSMVLVALFGLDKLTNATGMMLLFQGISCLISTPLCNVIRNVSNYDVTFYFAGICMIISCIVIIPVRRIAELEKQKEASQHAKN